VDKTGFADWRKLPYNILVVLLSLLVQLLAGVLGSRLSMELRLILNRHDVASDRPVNGAWSLVACIFESKSGRSGARYPASALLCICKSF